MDLECGKEPKEIHMLVNGSSAKQMDMEFIPGLMEIDIKANLKIVLNMVKVCKDLQMETFIKVFMLMENHQDSVNIIGLMEATLKDHLKVD
jgi:hypothetical protein